MPPPPPKHCSTCDSPTSRVFCWVTELNYGWPNPHIHKPSWATKSSKIIWHSDTLLIYISERSGPRITSLDPQRSRLRRNLWRCEKSSSLISLVSWLFAIAFFMCFCPFFNPATDNRGLGDTGQYVYRECTHMICVECSMHVTFFWSSTLFQEAVYS